MITAAPNTVVLLSAAQEWAERTWGLALVGVLLVVFVVGLRRYWRG